MATMSDLEQFNAITVDQMMTSEIYVPIPLVLMEADYYSELRPDAILVYGLCKRRLQLSLQNGWVDDKGRVYLEYSNHELQKVARCSKNTLLKIKKNLADHDLMTEVAQYTNADGQVSNRIYLGNVKAYSVEEMSNRRQEVREEAFRKRQEETTIDPSSKNERGEVKKCTGPVQNLPTKEYIAKEKDSSKGILSSRKTAPASTEAFQPAGTEDISSRKFSQSFVKSEYYSLLQVISDTYRDRCFGFPDILMLTHRQKMAIGQYLVDGYITSNEVINAINRIPDDSPSPLAYLLKSLENLKQERLLEAKTLAHQQAEKYYQNQPEGGQTHGLEHPDISNAITD